MYKAMNSLHSHHRLVMISLSLSLSPTIDSRTSSHDRCLPTYYTLHFLFQVLSGTFIQNKLDELWALVNWATDGSLLGTKTTFKRAFIDPIMAGQDPKATEKDGESSRSATMVILFMTYSYIIFFLHLLPR